LKSVVLALLFLFVGTGCREKADEVPSADIASQTMRGFFLTDFQNGMRSMTLKATVARLYETQNRAELDQPDAQFFKLGKPSSRLTAPQGQVNTDTHEVEAWGGVQVVSVDSDTLTTERLRYDPAKRLIMTDQPVRLERPDSVTEGIGLQSDPELQKVRIGQQKVRFK